MHAYPNPTCGMQHMGLFWRLLHAGCEASVGYLLHVATVPAQPSSTQGRSVGPIWPGPGSITQGWAGRTTTCSACPSLALGMVCRAHLHSACGACAKQALHTRSATGSLSLDLVWTSRGSSMCGLSSVGPRLALCRLHPIPNELHALHTAHRAGPSMCCIAAGSTAGQMIRLCAPYL